MSLRFTTKVAVEQFSKNVGNNKVKNNLGLKTRRKKGLRRKGERSTVRWTASCTDSHWE